MAIKVGITGGIGSGKTTVAKFLIKLGFPVYFADKEAKAIMNTDPDLMHRIKELLGGEAYVDGSLNKQFVASKVFADKAKLAQLNGIVHPAVANHFKLWCEQNETAEFVFQEAAILFENGNYRNFDKMILVTAPKEIRLARVMKRDKQQAKEVMARMNNQWSDEKKKALAHYVIRCDGKHLLMPQVLKVLKEL